jgi:hypothetical protein
MFFDRDAGAMRNVLLDNVLSYGTRLFLENRERRFSKIIYA